MKSRALKVASYNIHKAVGRDRRRDPERIIAVLREIDADIIALQEADLRIGQRASVLPRALLDDTSWQVVPVARRPRSIGWHGNALLVRRDIDVLDSEAMVLPMMEPRGAVCARLTVNGGNLLVYGTHLDLSGLRRHDQIVAILAHHRAAGGGPAILMGDFNQWSLRAGAMREFGPEWTPLAPGASFPSGRPIAKLDRIVVSATIDVEKQGAHRSNLSSVASDHLPIWATVTLPKK